MIRIKTFGFKTHDPRATAGAVVDCRDLRNPHSHGHLRPFTGRDDQIKDFVRADPRFATKMKEARYAASYSGGGDGICWIGCFGGRHRSVAIAELLAEELRGHGFEVELTHQNL